MSSAGKPQRSAAARIAVRIDAGNSSDIAVVSSVTDTAQGPAWFAQIAGIASPRSIEPSSDEPGRGKGREVTEARYTGHTMTIGRAPQGVGQSPPTGRADVGDEDGPPSAEVAQERAADDGVDVTLIRWMLSLSPDERLDVLQGFADSVAELTPSDGAPRP